MPNIKGNTPHNNGLIKASIKSETKNISAQTIQDKTQISSNLKPEISFINTVLSSDNNFIETNPKKQSNIIKTEVQSFGNATTEKKGIARLATIAEVVVGEDNSTIVTPYTLKRAVVSDKYYIHEQGIASNIWVINHNLNKKPSIMVVDSADNVVEGAEKYIDENTIEIRFNGAFKGKAYLN